MKLTVDRKNLLAVITPMAGIVERTTSVPVLSHVLLKVRAGRLEISATDLECSLTTSVDAKEMEAEGGLAVQMKKLLEIVRASEGDIELEAGEEGNTAAMLSIESGHATFKLRGLPAEDFPTLATLAEPEVRLELPLPVLRSMIGRTLFCVSAEESRFQLTAAFLRPLDGAVALVATDGHRLALVEADAPGVEEGEGVLVPRKVLQELLRLEGDGAVEIAWTKHHLGLTAPGWSLVARKLEGTFPDYERVIAKDHPRRLFFGRKALAEAVHRVALLCGERSRAVRLSWAEAEPGSVVFEAANPDVGEAREELPLADSTVHPGGDLVVGVNPDYLGEWLASVDTDRVRLELKDENSIIVCHPADGGLRREVVAIMPIRF
jgi:DNA polymerase-3 subunit beta